MADICDEVLKDCHKGETLYLRMAEKKLLVKLQESEKAVKNDENWLNLDELKSLV